MKTVVCVDPGWKRVYRYHLHTEQYILEQESPFPQSHLAQDLINLESLKGFDLTEWEFSSPSCTTYRHRRLRPSFLLPSASKSPVFTTSKALSPAFTDKPNIYIRVDLSSYILPGYFIPPCREREAYRLLPDIQSLDMRLTLVMNAEEVLREVLKATDHYQMKLKTHDSDHQFALKIAGKREFIRGNFPLFSFDGVRKLLRETDKIPLKLLEIPIEKVPIFPPIIPENEPISDIFPDYLYWYFPENASNQLHFPRFHRDFRSEFPSKSSNLRMKPDLELSCINTGECDCEYSLCLVGIDRISKLFLEGIWGKATKSGQISPDCVVFPHYKREKSLETGNKTHPTNSNESVLSTTSDRHSDSGVSRRLRLFSCLTNLNLSGNSEFCALFRLQGVVKWVEVEMMMVYGEKVVKFEGKECKVCSKKMNFGGNVRSEETLNFRIPVSRIPKETRICMNIHAVCCQSSFIIGSAMFTVYDETGKLRTGRKSVNIWPFYKVDTKFSCMSDFYGTPGFIVPKHIPAGELDPSFLEPGYAQVVLELQDYLTDTKWSLRSEEEMRRWLQEAEKPVKGREWETVSPRRTPSSRHPLLPFKSNAAAHGGTAVSPLAATPTTSQIATLEELLQKDSLEDLEEEEKKLLLCCREHYKTLPFGLPLFLRAVDWTEPEMVREAMRMVQEWTPLGPEDAICLLDTEFPDEYIRYHSILQLSLLSDDQVALFMPQFVQALQSETHHLSYLSEFLLERALRSPLIVGHELFWTLRSQLHFKPAAERFGVILEAFLMLCGGYREELLAEVRMIEWLKALGEGVKRPEGQEAKKKYLIERLASEGPDFSFPWTPCYDSRLQCQGIRSKGSVMTSAKKPILLSFLNSESSHPDIRLIFKVGDDMRQDILTIQLIRVMDSIWLENGLDLKMLTYRVVATHDQVGMVEFVPDASTTKEVSVEQGGGALGTLKKTTLSDYLREHAASDEQAYTSAVDNFIRSCAGYSVATYILGIGDRHNDNIMLTKQGQLFHIDYGHFLGNFKSVAGINRERSAFVLTKEMAYVMKKTEDDENQSEEFLAYEKYCFQAYNLIRRVGRRFIYLFQLMISAGMPELTSRHSIQYMRDKLALRLTERQAEEHFRLEINKALNNYFRKVDNMFHAFKHS